MNEFVVPGAMIRCALLPIQTLGRDESSLYAKTDDQVMETALKNPVFSLALRQASGTLWDELAVKDGFPSSAAARSVRRYLCRGASRSTPFGLFAAVAFAEVKEKLELAARSCDWRSRVSVSGDVLSRFWNDLRLDPGWCAKQRFRRNTTLVAAPSQFFYVSSQYRAGRNDFNLELVERQQWLDSVIEFASTFRTWAELIEELSKCATIAEAEVLALDLVESGLLESERGLPQTDQNPLEWLLAEMDGLPSMQSPFRELSSVATAASARSKAFEPTSRHVSAVGVTDPVESSLYSTSWIESDFEVPRKLVDEIHYAAKLMRSVYAGSDPLRSVREEFRGRYEDQVVPLLEAFGPVGGISLPSESANTQDYWAIATKVGRHIVQAFPIECRRGDRTIKLNDAAMQSLMRNGAHESHEFSCLVSLYGSDIYKGYLHAVYPAPSSALITRFCTADGRLRSLVDELHDNSEERRDTSPIVVEVVHDLGGRYGNISHRAVSRRAELLLFGHSGAAADLTFTVEDLLIGIRGGVFKLFDRFEGREVIPRISNAHAFDKTRYYPVYRLLGLLQNDGGPSGIGFSWGEMSALPALPRVAVGSIIVSLRSWDVPRAMRATRDSIKTFLNEFEVPSWVTVGVGDARLAVDVSCHAGQDELIRELARTPGARIYEMPERELGSPLTVDGAETACELVVPFKRDSSAVARASTMTPVVIRTDHDTRRRFVYCKVFFDSVLSSQFIARVLPSVVKDMENQIGSTGWFFVRYADPNYHVRLRFRTDDVRGAMGPLGSSLERNLRLAFPLSTKARVVFDEYVPEVNRYGGAELIEVAERMFHTDSETALRLWQIYDQVDHLDWEMICAHTTYSILHVMLKCGLIRSGIGDDLFGKPSDSLRRTWRARLRILQTRIRTFDGGRFERRAEIDEVLSLYLPRYESLARELASRVPDKPIADSLVTSLIHMHFNRISPPAAGRDDERTILEAAIRSFKWR